MDFDNKRIIPRYLFIIIPMTLYGLTILGTVAYQMTVKADYWEAVRDSIAKKQKDMPAIRGNIYSADRQLLVGSLPTYNLRMDFVIQDNDTIAIKKLSNLRDTIWKHEADSFCMGLHQLFPDKSAKEYFDLIEAHRRVGRKRNLLIVPNVSYIEYMESMKLPYARHGNIISGFYGERLPKRQKPYGTMAGRLMGSYDAAKDSAMNGLEFAFDSLLRGTKGKKHLERVRHYWRDKIDVEPIDGVDIITTIDVGMQDAAEKILTRKLVELNAEIGVVILLEVKTGDVKAMVNLTRVAPGQYADVQNHALTALWEPGSTFKTASMMVALEDGVIKRGDKIDTGNGQWPMYKRVMKDHNWHKGGYGLIDVDECLMYSSNVGVSRIIDEHYHNHPEKYVDGLYREGVGIPMQLQIPGVPKPNVRRPLADGSNWSNTALPWMSIGYETQIPPIYTVTFYNAIANNGRMVKPRFVTALEKDGAVIEKYPVEVIKERICSAGTLKDIREILQRVVNDPMGTGKPARAPRFKVCGKTGTAQVADKNGSYKSFPSRYMVSFAGFYPAEDPKYSCLVCIKKNGYPASGGGQAGPVFSELAQFVMAKGVYRTAEDASDSTSVFTPSVLNGDLENASKILEELGIDYQKDAHMDTAITLQGNAEIKGKHVVLHGTIATPENEVPDVIGMGIRDASRLLESRGLKVRVHGHGRIVKQSIPAYTHVVQGQTIILQLQPLSSHQ